MLAKIGPMPTQILFVRHGESEDNLKDLMSSLLTCAGLTQHGLGQAQRLAERLKKDQVPVDAVVTSGVLRASQTAHVIAKAFDLEPIRMDDLREIDTGDFEGDTWTMHRDHVAKMWDEDRDLRMTTGGETMNEYFDRIGAALSKIEGEWQDQSVVVVSHGLAIAAGLDRLVGESTDQLAKNASLTEFEVTAGEWRLVRFNDATHLH